MIPKHPEWSDFKEVVSLAGPSRTVPLPVLPRTYAEGLGPDLLNQSNGKVNTKNYLVYFDEGELFLLAENKTTQSWDDAVSLGVLTDVPDSLSLAFDQLGRPQVFFDVEGSIKLHGVNPQTETVETRLICSGGNPVAAMDYPIDTTAPTCDVILVYVINNQAKFRLQREGYLIDHAVTFIEPGEELTLIECGFRKDRRFGIRYTYKPSAGGGGDVTPPEDPLRSGVG